MQERSEAKRRANTNPAAGFDEGRPGVIQPVFSTLADITLIVTELTGPQIYYPFEPCCFILSASVSPT